MQYPRRATGRPVRWRQVPHRRVLWAVLLLGCALSALLVVRHWVDGWVVAVAAWAGTAVAAGDAVRSRRAYAAAIAERAQRAEETREEEAKRRVAEERMRIARELHDVVAHQIALANVQAGVAAHVMDRRPDQARQALAHVSEASRSALDELRATVGLLRQRGEPAAPMEPAPGLGSLDQLLDGFRQAGLQVTVEDRTGGEAAPPPQEPLPASVDLTAYRVIQESLTNVQKHAGPGAGAVVRIRRDPGALEVVVDDDGAPGTAASLLPVQGRPRPDAAGDGSSHVPPGIPCPGGPTERGTGGPGLLGMYERASALGGVCRAGARPGGGFRVWVRLPLSAPPRGQRHHPAAPAVADGTCG
ncbi:histidine kinase [Streptomyces cocklensis]|nr:histidine kinase [Actinacidiphila cocklensis]MDD1060340.1 histidine kinase [Actinacidiphila cocklensis]WSX74115.1 histidine kinase [Streptomyces sp. NBC_00899]WSX79820.1 histidine kinase [Streptomyces sp. NBC_00899]